MTSYREVFFAHSGKGPWPCYGCGEPVDLSEVHVHHIDHDHFNDAPENLTAMHSLCHQKLHKIGKSHSDETRQKMSSTRRGRSLSDEARARLSASTRGKPKSEEHKAALSRSLRGRKLAPLSEEHRRRIGDAKRLWWAQQKEKVS
jgi:hypothetical protein